MAPTATITYLGRPELLQRDEHGEPVEADVYQGFDPESRELVHMSVGVPTEVSEAKAQQVADDFPGVFEVNGEVAGERPQRSAEDESDGFKIPTRDELLEHTRADLNAAAAEIGIEKADELPNKGAVADAILAAIAARDEG